MHCASSKLAVYAKLIINLASPKMLFGTSVIIWHSQQAMVGFIFQDLCFRKWQFEPSVAYKSVADKKKRVQGKDKNNR